METQKVNYNNIPKSGYNSLQPESDVKTAVVSLRVRDIIVLSSFSIIQLIFGLTHVQKLDTAAFREYFHKNAIAILRVAGLLYHAHIAPQFKGEEDIIKLTVTREDVEVMVQLLHIRMAHCEKQRDEKDLNFNPDTYIGQKLLLIDLREWLLVEVITVSEVPKENHPVQIAE